MKRNLTHMLERTSILASMLNPGRLQARLDEWTRGGYPSSSYLTGSRTSTEPAMPAFDDADRTFRHLATRYRNAITAAAEQLEIARRIELIVIPPPKTDRRRYGLWRAEAARQAAEDHGPQAASCANCGRIVERTATDPLRSGRCTTCAMWRRRHGTDRPRDNDAA